MTGAGCRIVGLLAGFLVSQAVSATNPCLDHKSYLYQCSFSGTYAKISFEDCGLEDSDTFDMSRCFEDFGKENLQEVDLGYGNSLMFEDASSEDLFSGLTELKKLRIAGQPTKSFPAGIFRELTGLQHLNIFYNELTSFKEGLFSSLPALTTLSISHNQLGAGGLPTAVFSELRELTSLSLAFEDFTTVPAGLFWGLSTVTSLNLSGSKVTSLPKDVFAPLTDLRFLILYYTSPQCLPSTASSTRVYLDSNDEDVRSSRCECDLGAEDMCDGNLKCQPGLYGYTCE